MMSSGKLKDTVLSKSYAKKYIGTVCWFTGMSLTKRQATLEHLVPQSLLFVHEERNQPENLVATFPELNSMISNAPLSVKFALRKYLRGYSYINSMNMQRHEKVKFYHDLAKNFMAQYEVHLIRSNGKITVLQPWHFLTAYPEEDKEAFAETMKTAMYQLLTDEEKQLYERRELRKKKS